MKELDEIRARVVDYESRFVGSGSHAAQDRKVLLAAVEAVEKLVDEKYLLWAAICGETCCKDILGVDHDAIADSIASHVRAAITAALTPTPAVPSGAGEPRGAGDEYLGVDEKRGAQKGVQR